MIEDLGNIGDFLGGIAVVVTLIYVATQIRQNTKATRASTFLGLTNAWQDYLLTSARDDISRLLEASWRDPDSINERDAFRLWSIARVIFRRFENDFFQFKSGTFDRGAWEGYRNSLVQDLFSIPANRALWGFQREMFAPEFVQFVDEQIEGARALDPFDLTDFTQALKSAIREESAA